MRRLALFDFDGTLTTRDTMLAFARHVHGPVRYHLGLLWLGPMLVAYKLGMLRNDRAKRILLRHYFGGASREQLAVWGASFADRIDGWLRPGALERVRWHLDQGHEVLVVSASLDLWLGPWMERQGLRVLCTRGQFDDAGCFTGDLATANCHGEAKVERIREVLDLDGYDLVYAYGDSDGDHAMLAIAHETHYRPFRQTG